MQHGTCNADFARDRQPDIERHSLLTKEQQAMIDGLTLVQNEAHGNSRERGFWEKFKASSPDQVGMKLCLIHSELSEALEAVRKSRPVQECDAGQASRVSSSHGTNPCCCAQCVAAGSSDPPVQFLQDEHCPEFINFEIELADVIIRVMDLSGGMNLRVAEAVAAKMAYNRTRPYKHGKQC